MTINGTKVKSKGWNKRKKQSGWRGERKGKGSNMKVLFKIFVLFLLPQSPHANATLSLSVTHTHIHLHTLRHTLSLSLSLSHSYIHKHTHIHNTHARAHTHTPTQSIRVQHTCAGWGGAVLEGVFGSVVSEGALLSFGEEAGLNCFLFPLPLIPGMLKLD